MPLPLWWSLLACAPSPEGVRPIVTGAGFFDRPWPMDERRVDGAPDLSDFPGQSDIPLISAYVAEARKLDGFGLHAPIQLRTEAPPDLALLPGPDASTADDSPVWLLDIDRRSPERGRRIPWTAGFVEGFTTWEPGNLLSIEPVWGVPLRPATRYAVVFRGDLLRGPGDFTADFATDPSRLGLLDLAETLFAARVDPSSVDYAFAFTTQDPVSEMARVADRQRSFDVPALDQAVELEFQSPWFRRYRGVVRIPIWQHGTAPYSTEGGGFRQDADGRPLLWAMEEVAFTLTVPRQEEMPPDGWPVVIIGHGTGGDRNSFASSTRGDEQAALLARAGMAGFGISLPFHGDRGAGASPELVSFNLFNPESGRCAFRQAALEQVWLAHVLAARGHHFHGEGLDARTDPARVGYLGHSHGAQTGILALPFFGEDVRGSVLSSGGAGLGIAVVERDAGDFDIQGLLREALGFAPHEELKTTHPIVGLVQLVAESTDPLSYAPYWLAEEPWWPAVPQNVLLFQGLQDVHTPPATMGALVAAARVPILAPVAQTWPAQSFVDPQGDPTPARANAVAWDGRPVTAGMLQYPERDHFAIYDDPGAQAIYPAFLANALGGAPEIPAR
jgi:hypothetical protein